MKSLAVGLLVLLTGLASASANAILDVAYEKSTSMLSILVAFEGSSNDHNFVLEIGECMKNPDDTLGLPARLIDLDGDETGSLSFEQWVVVDLSQVSCKPSLLTIRSGRKHQASVYID